MTRAVRWSIIIAASMVAILCLLLIIGMLSGRSGPEGEYLDLAHEDYPDTSDARLLEVGYEVCDEFDSGGQFAMISAAALSPMHEDLMPAAVVTLCPEHQP